MAVRTRSSARVSFLSKSEDGDAVSVWESWLLQTETFGVFAKDDSRDGIVHAAGNLVMEDWMKGVKQFQAQVEEAKTLKVSLRYHQTIFRYMLKLRQHRPRIATQLERKWGNLPEGWKAEQDAVPSISLFIAVLGGLHAKYGLPPHRMTSNAINDIKKFSAADRAKWLEIKRNDSNAS